jgi:hypothetical protein
VIVRPFTFFSLPLFVADIRDTREEKGFFSGDEGRHSILKQQALFDPIQNPLMSGR